jgi:hypothetical protein
MLGLAQKQLHILSADASGLAALRKFGICLIFLHFRALPGRRLNPKNLQIYFCANPKRLITDNLCFGYISIFLISAISTIDLNPWIIRSKSWKPCFLIVNIVIKTNLTNNMFAG